MLLLIFLCWFTYELMMLGIIVSAWALRVAFWIIAAVWRLGGWCWKRHEQKRRRESRQP